MRRTPHQVNRKFVTRKSGLVVIPTISLFALVVYLWAAHSVIRKWSIPADTGRRVRCVSWRRTHTCSPFGLVAFAAASWVVVYKSKLVTGSETGLGTLIVLQQFRRIRDIANAQAAG